MDSTTTEVDGRTVIRKEVKKRARSEWWVHFLEQTLSNSCFRVYVLSQPDWNASLRQLARFLNSTFVPRRNISAASPQTTTGDPITTDRGQRQGDSGGDHGRRNNCNLKGKQGRHDDEEIY
jgi:hypothetical protein